MVKELADFTSDITEEELQQFASDYYIPSAVHPEVPAANASILDFPDGKIGVYTRFFEFANQRIPISLFLSDVLNYYRIHLSQLHCIGAAKLINFEVNCHLLAINPTIHLFRAFYHTTWSNGWVSFAKRPGSLQCYTDKLDALRNWRETFFWIDNTCFPSQFDFYAKGTLPKDERPLPGSYNVEDAETINANRIPISSYPEEFLVHIGLSHNYFGSPEEVPIFLDADDQEMDLFSVVHLAKPTEVKVGTRALKEGEEPVLAAVGGRTVVMDLGEAGESSSVALQATPVQSMPSGIAQTPPAQPTPITTEHVEEIEEAEESPELERKRKRTGDGAATSRKKRPVIFSVESSSSDVASRPPSPVTAIPAIEQSAESPPHTSPMRTESSGLKDQGAEPNTAEEVPTGLLIDDLVSLATQIKVKYSGEASQNAEKDKRIASLEAQLASARDEAKTLGTHATKLAEEKMALMCQINQERAEAASYKSTCLWAIKYLENSKDALTTQLEDFGTTVKNALEAQEEKLRKLSIEYDEELYPQLLSTIAERRWLISHGLRLAALSVLESQEVRDSFGNVVKCALERGKSEAVEKLQEADLLKVPVEQVPNYDVKAYDNLVAAMEKMKDLELPKIAELERDQDYPINVIFAGLTLARHLGGEAVAQPDYYLRPDASQLQVPVFARPRDILDPFVIDKEVPLKQVLEAHAARLAERKGIKGKAVMCGVGAAHLPRSDGVPVSVATVARRDAELLQELNRIGENTNRVGSSSLKRSHSF